MKDRYWSKVKKRGPNECWEWQAKRMSDGYGQIKVSGKWLSAHRLSWEFRNGTIPEGMSVLHRCDNPPCVNPDHLFIGTAQDNWDDAKAKGLVVRHGEHNPNARLTAVDVRRIRALHNGGTATRAEIADEFGISPSHLTGIVQRKSWRHI